MTYRAWMLLALAAAAGAQPAQPVASLNSAEGVRRTFLNQAGELGVVTGEGQTTDGDGALRLYVPEAPPGDGNRYFGILVPLPEPVDLRDVRVLLDARTEHPETTMAFYVRFYNQGETKAAWSFASWSSRLTEEWRTFSLQPGLSPEGLDWEAAVVEDRVADRVDRVELIIGTNTAGVPVSLLVDNLRTAEPLRSIDDLTAAKPRHPDTVLARGGQPAATVLHPDSDAGRAAAAQVVEAVRARSGATLPMRVATADDRQTDENVILLGNVENNPALLLFYARRFTPVDDFCPGLGGTWLQTVHDPFGRGANAVVVGGSDDAGLAASAEAFAAAVAALPEGGDLVLPQTFQVVYSEEFLTRYRWADDAPREQRLAEGLAQGRKVLDEGGHTSVAGVLRDVAMRYAFTHQSEEAKLFVALWDLYVESAVADPRKFGGPWGFDSDFPSYQVITGWNLIEEDPSLTDEERLRTTKSMARWVTEAVASSTPRVGENHVTHNHATFAGLGTLAAGLYFDQYYDVIEGPTWMALADQLFRSQSQYYKPHEDCNGYQWLTIGHTLQYAVARPDYTVFENGNSKRMIDYCLGTMDNLSYQVPYGDTGSWMCWTSEQWCLNVHAFATGDPAAKWAAATKRRVRNTFETFGFMQRDEGERPDAYDGVTVMPLEPAYVASSSRDGEHPPLDVLFDKISFRDEMDPASPYLLLDGLNNGGHNHYDGNSLPRLTQFDRIWLADNDYYKKQVKYHNSMLVFREGESAEIPPYAELMAAGENNDYGYSRTKLSAYSGVDWDRTVVWLKDQDAFVVIDRLVPEAAGEYQFRLLWHGVGEATLDDDGLLLTQKGPALRIDVAPGPEKRLVNDAELGTNWNGYPHAEPVVRSLSAIAKVRLQAGEPYLYATVFHGSADSEPMPWRLSHIKGMDGFLLQTDQGQMAIGVGPVDVQTEQGAFLSDAQVLVLEPEQLTLLQASEATAGGFTFHDSPEPTNAAFPTPEAALALQMLPLEPGPENLSVDRTAPEHPVEWEARPLPEHLVLTGNRGMPGALGEQPKLTVDPAPAPENVFTPSGPNAVEAMLDGGWDSTHNSVMFEPDQTVTLTLDFGAPVELDNVAWKQWWSTTSSKNTSYMLQKATLTASNDAFAADQRVLGEVTDEGEHPNFGSPIDYGIDAQGATARYLRLTVEPKPGSAVYLAEVIAEGEPARDAEAAAAYHFTKLVSTGSGADARLVGGTAEGAVVVLSAAGEVVWSKPLGATINDIAAADFDGDGRDEFVVARQDHFATLLDDDGTELWSRELKYYRRPPYVNVAAAGDITGDGVPEAVVGGENWRFYAFTAAGEELWNYESVHPSRSGVVADLNGDGQAETVCGTHYYWISTLKPDGTLLWRYRLGPICYDLATGSFDNNDTRGVVAGGGDGLLHYLSSAGEPRLQFNTGDEVRVVAAADLDGDGVDEVIGGSMNHNVYCFGADAERRWRRDLDDAVVQLTTVPVAGGAVVAAATDGGRLATFGADGSLLGLTELDAPVVAMTALENALVVATADGRVRRLAVTAR